MLKHLLPIVAATLLLLIVFASAIPLFHWFQLDDTPESMAQFAQQREQWLASGTESYEFVLRKDCSCAFPGNVPIRIVVRDSLNIAAYDSRQNFDSRTDKIDNIPLSVAELFALIEDASRSSELVSVTYDETYAFPNRIVLDPDSGIAGDTVTWSVNLFRANTADL